MLAERQRKLDEAESDKQGTITRHQEMRNQLPAWKVPQNLTDLAEGPPSVLDSESMDSGSLSAAAEQPTANV